VSGRRATSKQLWPLLVALEGPSGCGKSTLVPLVAAGLVQQGVPALAVSNNDSGRWGPVIRDLAGRPDRSLTLALATAAARAELREGSSHDVILICDRYVMSSFVYQGFAGVSQDALWGFNADLMAGASSYLLQLSAVDLERRRGLRPAGKTDWFKGQLTAQDEIQLFAKAADALGSRGHSVKAVDAAPIAQEVAGVVIGCILRDRESLR